MIMQPRVMAKAPDAGQVSMRSQEIPSVFLHNMLVRRNCFIEQLGFENPTCRLFPTFPGMILVGPEMFPNPASGIYMTDTQHSITRLH